MTKIQRLPAGRWEEYRALRLEALKKEAAAFGSSVEDEVALTEDDWKTRIENTLFAMSGESPVGMIAMVGNNRRKTKHVADIFGVYVKPRHRDKGIGTKLVQAAIREARSKGIVKVRLEVNPEQKAAIRLYRKAGFKVVGKARKDLKVGRRFYDLVYLEKFL